LNTPVSPVSESPRLDATRLLGRLDQLAAIGATGDGGCCRLALTDADRAGRDQLVAWMRALGLQVRVDPIGNVFGWRAGREALAPVMTGSHVDTVRTGGRFDGKRQKHHEIYLSDFRKTAPGKLKTILRQPFFI
jgi:N-carbamoyl-L-amino-acid hydrolase